MQIASIYQLTFHLHEARLHHPNPGKNYPRARSRGLCCTRRGRSKRKFSLLAYLPFGTPITPSHPAFIVLRQIFKTLHTAYAAALSNPFLRMAAQADNSAPVLTSQSGKNNLGKRVDEIVRVIGTIPVVADEQV